MRYRLIYPWIAQHLFPMPKVGDNGFIRPTISGTLQEDTRAYDGHKTGLLQEAQSLHERMFHFLNLQPVNLGNPIDWTFAPESDRLWQYNLHYGEWAVTLMASLFGLKRNSIQGFAD